MRRIALFAVVVACACGRETGLDTVVDSSADPAIWRRDAEKIAGALPHAIGAFAPREAVDPFATSYRTGPVFGASCVYADGGKQLLVRVESGNIAARSVAALDPGTPSGAKAAGRQLTVKGSPAVARWDEDGRESEITFLVSRRFIVQLRVVPAAGAGEAPLLAEAFDEGALKALSLEGVR